MGTVPIYKLTGSVSGENNPVIRVNALLAGGLTNSKTKLLQFFRDNTSVFVVNADGSILSSGSINTGTNGIKLPSGTTNNSITYYDGTKITAQPYITFTNPSFGVFRLNVTGSTYAQNIIEGKSSAGGFSEGSIYIAVDNNKRIRFPNNADLQSVGPERMGIRVLNSGSIYFTLHPSSSNFINSSRVQRSTAANSQQNFHNILQIQDNTFYFWPTQYSLSTIGRGAALGIGVLPGTTLSSSACKAALHINVFSASVNGMGSGAWQGTATSVQNRQTAILVTYGSGSLGNPFATKFFVSSSGNMYSAGNFQLDRVFSCSGNIRNAPLVSDGPVYSKGGILTNVNPVSDFRLKDEIQPITYGLSEISNLNPVTYFWKRDADPKKRFGFIAQEVQPYIPELVGQDTNGYYNLNTFDLIPILVNAIKELKDEVDALKAKLP